MWGVYRDQLVHACPSLERVACDMWTKDDNNFLLGPEQCDTFLSSSFEKKDYHEDNIFFSHDPVTTGLYQAMSVAIFLQDFSNCLNKVRMMLQ